MTAIPTSRISSRRFIGLVVGSVLTAGLAAVAVAQQPAPAPDKAARQQELDALQAEQRKAADAEAMLKSEIATLGEDRRKLNEALLTTAGRLRLAENNIAATETRLKKLEDKERTVRKSLEGRRAVITEILAALERIGRRPPPCLPCAPPCCWAPYCRKCAAKPTRLRPTSWNSPGCVPIWGSKGRRS